MLNQFRFLFIESDLLNVILLTAAIIYLGNKFLPKIINERNNQISKEIEDAKQARIKAEKELEEVKQKTTNILHEINEIKEGAKKSASLIKKQIEEETENDLEKLRQKIKKEIISSHQEAINDIKRATSTAALKLAEEALTQISKNNEVQKKLLSDFLVELDKPSKN